MSDEFKNDLEVLVLLAAQGTGPCTLSNARLHELLGLPVRSSGTSSTLQRSLERLIADGYVIRIFDQGGKRSLFVTVSGFTEAAAGELVRTEPARAR
jgi:DNA-binding MarR family transcriptional regulator